MKRTTLALAAAGLLTLAGCGGSDELGEADRAACDSLDEASDPGELYEAFGQDAYEELSEDLGAYAQLVGAQAQLADSGAGDGEQLAEYVGQMRGACQTLGWQRGD